MFPNFFYSGFSEGEDGDPKFSVSRMCLKF